ncbi:hypothetical protein E8E14_003471 [Neopestalotiopsis sp. 37M]|nr:hypothetical protein E8E14_003471 [Neopestalotiopsis sp. 37M]
MSSSMIAKAAALKPEIRLAQSVSEFEASLSDKHKATFRCYRSQSFDKTLGPTDVMRLTAEIDRRTVQENGVGQCFGPRLTNVLQAVQQYAALGDVIIGGSQNIIACGIWSLLRLTLLALVSFSSYMEKLSKLLMVAGRKAPRYEHMALLYPRSLDLQSNLSEYFIVIVQLCRKLYKATQKTTFGSYFSFLSDLDLKEHETSLQLWADCIKDEVTLLTARKISEQSTFLGVISKNSQYESHNQRLKHRLRILEACSTYNHQETWKEIRKLGTSTLLAQIDQYAEWEIETESCTLLCTGKLGSGKSVFLANMVDELHLSTKSTGTAVIYFFCRHDIQDSLSARTIIGSIARQLISTNVSELPGGVLDITNTLGVHSLLDLVLSIIPKTKGAFVVLDGLDECDDRERKTTLECLKRLQKAFPLKICCSLRSDMHLRAIREAKNILINSKVVHLPDDNPDISSFISSELQRLIESGCLCIGDASLVSDIQHALVERAHARRPLTTGELQEALSVVPYDIEWKPAQRINNIFAVLAFCGSLITIDEEHLTVRLLHHSVKQYLLGDFAPMEIPILNLKDAETAMGEVVITYLNYNDFENAVSKRVFAEILAQNIPSSVATSVLRQSSPARQMTQRMFRRQQGYQYDLRNILISKREGKKQNVDFHAYARSYWICHVQSSFHQIPKAMFLLLRLLKKNRVDVNDQDDHGETLLLRIVPLVNAKVAQTLLYRGARLEANFKLYRDKAEADGSPALSVAARHGDILMIVLLLNCGADIEARDDNGRTAFFTAARQGQLPVLEFLLLEGANIEAKDHQGATSLFMAAETGRTSILEWLHDSRGANIHTKNHDGMTPLMIAAKQGNSTSVEFLLDRGALIEAKDKNGWTPLHWAVFNGHDDVVRILLLQNADIEATDHTDWTPLLVATYRAHRSIMEVLLVCGSDTTVSTKSGWSAFQMATYKDGTKDILRNIRYYAAIKAGPGVIHRQEALRMLDLRLEPMRKLLFRDWW